jgi:hypothetical protein
MSGGWSWKTVGMIAAGIILAGVVLGAVSAVL